MSPFAPDLACAFPSYDEYDDWFGIVWLGGSPPLSLLFSRDEFRMEWAGKQMLCYCCYCPLYACMDWRWGGNRKDVNADCISRGVSVTQYPYYLLLLAQTAAFIYVPRMFCIIRIVIGFFSVRGSTEPSSLWDAGYNVNMRDVTHNPEGLV